MKLEFDGISPTAPDGSALVEALRDTHRHIEELERIQAGSRSCVMTHEAKKRAEMLTERIIALSQNAHALAEERSDDSQQRVVGGSASPKWPKYGAPFDEPIDGPLSMDEGDMAAHLNSTANNMLSVSGEREKTDGQ